MTLQLRKRNGFWHVEGRVMGQRVRQSTRLPDTPQYKSLAEKTRMAIEMGIIEGTHGGKQVTETFGDALELYRQWKQLEKRLTPKQDRKLEKLAEFWGDVKLKDITTAAVTSYVTHHWSGLEPGTIRRYLNDFRAVLNHAGSVIDGYSPCKIQMPLVKDQRDVHFDENEATAFLDWVYENEPHYYPHFLTLIDTGVRLNELLSLKRASFSDDVLRVRRRLVRSGKTQTRDIPYTEPMAALAQLMKCREGVCYRAQGGEAWRTSDSASATLNNVLKRGCEELGIDGTGKDRMRVHDLRHTFAYLTAKAGADLGDLQYLMGHEDISQTMRYRGFIQSRARTFVRSLRRSSDVSGQTTGQQAS